MALRIISEIKQNNMGRTGKTSGTTAKSVSSRTRSNKKTFSCARKTAKKTESDMAGVWFEEIRQLSKKDEHVTPEFGQLKTADINMNSDRFQRKQQSLYGNFVTFCSTSNCYKDKMEPVEYVTKAGQKIDAPALFIACLCEDGKISKDKVKLANQIYVDFAKQMKMKKILSIFVL